MADCPSSVSVPVGLVDLPSELLDLIGSALHRSDVKQLRLACRRLGSAFALSLYIQRVFISPNPKNVEVLHSIADHETFRHGVTEIVWDDAQLIRAPVEHSSASGSRGGHTRGDLAPSWFRTEWHRNISDIEGRLMESGKRPDQITLAKQFQKTMRVDDCWTVYEELVQQEDQVLASGADVDAFRRALDRFPRLRRIIVTPAAHGLLFLPLYPTPMLRSLPYGFNYPIPRGWPTRWDMDEPDFHEWKSASEEYKDKWRGFRIVLRLLAQTDHNVSELIVDSHQINTGINSYILQDESCEEYQDLVNILGRPGFRRLELSILVKEHSHLGPGNWPSLGEGGLRRALARAKDMEHFKLFISALNGLAVNYSDSLDWFVPLKSVIPIDCWPRLRHIALSHYFATEEDTLSFLSELPPQVRSVELSFLLFIDPGGSYKNLLTHIRDKLDWGRRTVSERPHFVIKLDLGYIDEALCLRLDQEVDEFIYGDRERLFGDEHGASEDMVLVGMGGFEVDELNPAHRVPNV